MRTKEYMINKAIDIAKNDPKVFILMAYESLSTMREDIDEFISLKRTELSINMRESKVTADGGGVIKFVAANGEDLSRTGVCCYQCTHIFIMQYMEISFENIQYLRSRLRSHHTPVIEPMGIYCPWGVERVIPY